MKVFLETQRLLLREFTEDDAGDLFALDGDPEVMRHIGPFQLADAEAYRRHIRERWRPYYLRLPVQGYWAAVEKPGGAFLGWFHLRPALDYRFAVEAGYRPGEMDLGYRFRRAAWGKGYATEGALALVHKAFSDTDAARVVSCALAGNRASIRVMEKAGLRPAGEFRIPGYDQPAVKYALAREDYRPYATD